MCVQMRSGVQIWEERENILKLQQILESIDSSKFVSFGEQTINTADIVGIFTAETMADYTRRKNGEWQCAYGEWHEKFDKCFCAEVEERMKQQEKQAKEWLKVNEMEMKGELVKPETIDEVRNNLASKFSMFGRK